MKTLLIVHHSFSGTTRALAEAVLRGAGREPDTVRATARACCDVDAGQLVAADALAFGCPEMLGYMSGGLKDLFDRTHVALQERVVGRPYAVFVAAGWDGHRAVAAIDEIASGLGMRKVALPLIATREEGDAVFARCEELGHTLAAGLELGIF